jgi:hypothetical protein
MTPSIEPDENPRRCNSTCNSSTVSTGRGVSGAVAGTGADATGGVTGSAGVASGSTTTGFGGGSENLMIGGASAARRHSAEKINEEN